MVRLSKVGNSSNCRFRNSSNENALIGNCSTRKQFRKSFDLS